MGRTKCGGLLPPGKPRDLGYSQVSSTLPLVAPELPHGGRADELVDAAHFLVERTEARGRCHGTILVIGCIQRVYCEDDQGYLLPDPAEYGFGEDLDELLPDYDPEEN